MSTAPPSRRRRLPPIPGSAAYNSIHGIKPPSYVQMPPSPPDPEPRTPRTLSAARPRSSKRSSTVPPPPSSAPPYAFPIPLRSAPPPPLPTPAPPLPTLPSSTRPSTLPTLPSPTRPSSILPSPIHSSTLSTPALSLQPSTISTVGRLTPTSPISPVCPMTPVTPISPAVTWMDSQEYLRDETDSASSPLTRSTDVLVSEWESDTDEGDEDDEGVASEGDSDGNDPRGPAWTWQPPPQRQVRQAGHLPLFDEWGREVMFSELLPQFPDEITKESSYTDVPPVRRLVVFFVGHWWCGLCHDYALMSVARLSKAALVRQGVRVALISSGSWKAIGKFRSMFNIPFPVYVDRGTKLYGSLGMRTSFPNPFSEGGTNRPKYHRHGFARQMVTGVATGMRMTTMKGSPGNILQLGGEFVFGPNYKCEFAHRMQGRGDHCEAPDVLRAVGLKGEGFTTKSDGYTDDAVESPQETGPPIWRARRQSVVVTTTSPIANTVMSVKTGSSPVTTSPPVSRMTSLKSVKSVRSVKSLSTVNMSSRPWSPVYRGARNTLGDDEFQAFVDELPLPPTPPQPPPKRPSTRFPP